jgi:cyclophilin family peptidyl-prolyl cis-trans isomerase
LQLTWDSLNRMSTYEPEDGRDGIRSRALLIAAAVIAVTGIAAFVGSAVRDTQTALVPASTVVSAQGVETPAPPTTLAEVTTLPPTTAAPEARPCPKPAGTTQARTFPLDPPFCIDMAAKYRAKIRTDKGTIWITLDQNVAPKTVNNFVYLARYGFYDGLSFHRVISDFLIQTGSPDASGEGGPGYTIPAESGTETLKPGTVVMADRSNGSQFFIVSGGQATGFNPADFNPIGVVSQGLDVVKKIDALGVAGQETPKTLVAIKSLEIVAENEGGPSAEGGSTTTAPGAPDNSTGVPTTTK